MTLPPRTALHCRALAACGQRSEMAAIQQDAISVADKTLGRFWYEQALADINRVHIL